MKKYLLFGLFAMFTAMPAMAGSVEVTGLLQAGSSMSEGCSGTAFESATVENPVEMTANFVQNCPAGKYLNIVSSLDDVPADIITAGTYSTINGVTTGYAYCESCDEGHYCVQTPTEVTHGTGENAGKLFIETQGNPICPVGYSCPDVSQDKVACKNGLYQDTEGQTSCKSCDAGYYCPDGENVANAFQTQCAAGSYTDETGQSSCSLCLTGGTYQNQSGQTSCLSCPAGKYSDALDPASVTGNTSCKVCDKGKYSAVEGASSCSVCPDGTYSGSSANGNTECTQCPIDTYNTEAANNAGVSACQACPAGYKTGDSDEDAGALGNYAVTQCYKTCDSIATNCLSHTTCADNSYTPGTKSYYAGTYCEAVVTGCENNGYDLQTISSAEVIPDGIASAANSTTWTMALKNAAPLQSVSGIYFCAPKGGTSTEYYDCNVKVTQISDGTKTVDKNAQLVMLSTGDTSMYECETKCKNAGNNAVNQWSSAVQNALVASIDGQKVCVAKDVAITWKDGQNNSMSSEVVGKAGTCVYGGDLYTPSKNAANNMDVPEYCQGLGCKFLGWKVEE